MSTIYQNNFDAETVGTLPTGFANVVGTGFAVRALNPVSAPNAFGETSGDSDGDIVLYTAMSHIADQSSQMSGIVQANVAPQNPCIFLRSATDGSSGYAFNFSPAPTPSTLLVFAKTDPSTYVAVTNATGTGAFPSFTLGQTFIFKAEVQGTTIRARAWLATNTEPTTWQFQGTDSHVSAAGVAGLRNAGGPAATPWTVDNYFIGTPGTVFGALTSSLTYVSATYNSVTLTAGAAGGTPPYSYQLYRSLISGQQGTLVLTNSDGNFVDSTVAQGTLYFYTAVITDAAAATANSSQVAAVTYKNSGIYPMPTINAGRNGQNPALVFGTGSYNSDIGNPLLLHDTVNNRWVILYNQYGIGPAQWSTKLAFATYNTGDKYLGALGPYTYYSGNPVDLPQGGEGYIFGNGGVVYTGSQWIMLCQTQSANGAFLATSPDLITWTRVGIVIPLGAGGQPDSAAIADCWVMPNPSGTGFICVYAGNNGSVVTFMYATSNAAGTVWTKHGILYSVPASFSSSNIGEPTLIIDSAGAYYLTFDYAITTDVRSVGGVYSPDGIHWTDPFNVLSPGAPENFDSVCVFDSCPTVVNGNYLILYAGGTHSGGSQGMMSQAGFASINSGGGGPIPPTTPPFLTISF